MTPTFSFCRMPPHPSNIADGGPVFCLIRRHPDIGVDSDLCVDADDGEVVDRNVADIDQPLLDEALATRRVGDQMVNPMPWPYGTTEPLTPKRDIAVTRNARNWMPDPASGMLVRGGVTEGPPGEDSIIRIETVRSNRTISGYTGAILAEQMDEGDVEAFDRWNIRD